MHLCFAVGIASYIVSVATLPIAGKSGLDSFHLHFCLKPQKADFDPGPNGLGTSAHPSIGELDGISARSSEDIVPVEECKRGLRAASISDEALYRRCAGEGDGEGEEESGAESDSEEDSSGDTGGDDNADEDAENIQLASNSPRQDCILTQMALFPMPNIGLCESLPDTLPKPKPAPPVTPVPAPVTPEPQPVPAPAPAHKPVPVHAGGPARAIPKRANVNPVPGRVLAQSLKLGEENPACEESKSSLCSLSSARIQLCFGGAADKGGDGDGN